MKKILVVEDQPTMLASIARYLVLRGFDVLEAPSAAVALRLACEQCPDLVLADINLGPVRDGETADGIELCRKLKEDQSTNHIPVIMLSAHGDEAHVIASHKAQAADFLVKPCDSELLIRKIQEHLAMERPPLPLPTAPSSPVSGVGAEMAAASQPAASEVPGRRGTGLAAMRKKERHQ